jgi:hypothetical protein
MHKTLKTLSLQLNDIEDRGERNKEIVMSVYAELISILSKKKSDAIMNIENRN